MDQPMNAQKCGICYHAFGAHFEFYDGSITGCGYRARDQRDDSCRGCTGFAWVRKWRPSAAAPREGEPG